MGMCQALLDNFQPEGNMRHMNSQQIVDKFREDVEKGERGRIVRVAKATAIPVKNLRNLYYGYTDTMSFDSLIALERFYRKRK
jgi:hypothetical protein